MNIWSQLVAPVQAMAEWVYDHSGQYLFRPTRIFYSFAVDALDLWVLVATGVIGAAAHFIPGLSLATKPIFWLVSLVQLLAAGMLWGRWGVVVLVEDILTLTIGILPGVGLLIEALPLVTIAGVYAMVNAPDRRTMSWARTGIGEGLQWVTNGLCVALGFKLLPWLWYTVDKGMWLIDKIMLGMAKILQIIF